MSEQQIIEKTTSLLEVQYIYLVTKVDEDNLKKVWIVILKGSCTSLTKELSAMVAKIFQEETDFLYRIFSSEYAEQKWHRFAGFFMMGKERKSHGIKELQIYIKSYAPKLGCLFNTEKEEELHLLKLLDDAYIATRYENNYHINKEQISEIEAKANLVHTTVAYLFKTKLEAAKKLLDSGTDFESQNFNKITTNQKESRKIGNKKTLKKLKSYADEHFDLLKRNIYRKNVYDIRIETNGYLDTSYLTANLIKVSIMALKSMEATGQSVDAGDYAVQQVLKCVLKLIPYEEMEFMDKVRDLLSKAENH